MYEEIREIKSAWKWIGKKQLNTTYVGDMKGNFCLTKSATFCTASSQTHFWIHREIKNMKKVLFYISQ